MITFTHSWAPLVGGLAAAGMIAAWWLIRLATPRRIFPPLIWMRLAARRRSHWRHSSPWLHLSFAVSSMLLLGLLFGRPSLGPAQDPHGAVIIVMDGSLSMATRAPKPLFAEGRRMAGLMIQALDDRSRANLAIAGASPDWAFQETPAGRSRQPLWRLLEKAAPDHTGGSLKRTIDEAIDKLNQVKAFQKTLHIVSDFQKDAGAAADMPPHEGIRIALHPVGAPCVDNTAIHAAGLARFSGFPGESVELAVRLVHQGPKSKAIRLTWTVNRQAVHVDDLTLPGLSNTRAARRLTFPAPGIYECSASITPHDTLIEDDTFFMTAHILEACRAKVAAGGGSLDDLLLQAISGHPACPVKGEGFLESNASQSDVLIIAGHQPAALSAAVKAHIPVILFTTAPEMVRRADGPRAITETGDFRLTGGLQGSTRDSLPALASVRSAKRLRLSSKGIPLCLFADNQPAVALFPESRLILGLFDLTLDKHGLLQNEDAAVILLGELIRLSLGMRQPALTAGRRQALILPQQQLRFFAPHQAECFPVVTPAESLAQVALPGFPSTGFFRIWHDNRIETVLPVNPPPAESSPQQNRPSSLRTRETVSQADPPSLTPGLLLGLFAMALVWFVMASRGRQSEGTP